MRVLLVRHPAPITDSQVCYGRLDVTVGTAELCETARRLRSQLPSIERHGVAVWSSPARRCRALGDLIAGDVPLRCSDDLREIDFGIWEGQRWSEIPRAQLDAWALDVWNYRVGEGESARMVERRWQRWVDTLKSESLQGASPQSVIAITHAGLIRVALVSSGSVRAKDLLNVSIAFGSVHEVLID